MRGPASLRCITYKLLVLPPKSIDSLAFFSPKSDRVQPLGTTTMKKKGGGGGKLSGASMEYGCARRLRHRLLLSYLSQQGLHPTFQSMIQQTDAHLSAEHLRDLVARGRWGEATDYLGRFNRRRSLESQALYLFLHTLSALDVVAAAGASGGAVPLDSYHHGITVSAFISSCPELCYLVKDMLSSPRQCASLDWKLVCTDASLTAYDLAHESPDLTRLIELPGGAQVLPHNVLPICPRRRRHVRRSAGRPPGLTIAKLYLDKRTSLYSSNPCSGASFIDESLDWAARYLGICLRAGRRQELQQGPPLQTFGKQAPASISFGDMMAMKMDGGGGGKLSGPVKYDRERRLRHRLVLSYLSQQGLHLAFQSMVQQTDAHLCLKHLQQLVARSLWSEAVCYVCRFLASGTGKAIEDRPLLLFLYVLWTFANIAASASHAAVAPDTHRNDLALCMTVCRNLKLRTIVVRLLKLPQFRASLNWGVICNKASFIACDLARVSPELSHRVVLPSDPAALHDVLPICPRRRHYVKGPPRRPPARTITKLYLNKRRSLSSSSLQPGFATNSLNQVADLIMKCFNIGESLEFLQSSKKEDAPGAPLSQTMFNTLTDPAKTIGTSSVKNAGAPVSLPAKTSGILSGTYAGTTDTIQDVVLRKNPRTELSTVREDPDPKRQRICVKLASVHRPEAEVHRMNLMA